VEVPQPQHGVERFRRYLVVAAFYAFFVKLPSPASSASGAPNGLPLRRRWPERHPVAGRTEGLNGTLCGLRWPCVLFSISCALIPAWSILSPNSGWSERQVVPPLEAEESEAEIVTMGPPRSSGATADHRRSAAAVGRPDRGPDTLVIDTRNTYEVTLVQPSTGRSIRPPQLRDFPAWWSAISTLWWRRASPRRLPCSGTGGIVVRKARPISSSRDRGVHSFEGGDPSLSRGGAREPEPLAGECFRL